MSAGSGARAPRAGSWRPRSACSPSGGRTHRSSTTSSRRPGSRAGPSTTTSRGWRSCSRRRRPGPRATCSSPSRRRSPASRAPRSDLAWGSGCSSSRAQRDPVWSRFVARVWKVGGLELPVRDLDEAIRLGHFRVPGREVAQDLLFGGIREAMHRIGEGSVRSLVRRPDDGDLSPGAPRRAAPHRRGPRPPPPRAPGADVEPRGSRKGVPGGVGRSGLHPQGPVRQKERARKDEVPLVARTPNSALDHQGDALAAADAERGHAALLVRCPSSRGAGSPAPGRPRRRWGGRARSRRRGRSPSLGSSLRIWLLAMATTAKASLISQRSTSAAVVFVRSSSFLMASAGAMVNSTGLRAAVA